MAELLVFALVSFIDTMLLVWLILGSRLTGWRLMLLVAVVYYGIKTFMMNIEAVFFMSNISRDMISGLFLMTAPTALIFPPLAVWILGKARRAAPSPEPLPALPLGQWVAKLAALSILVYPALYFTFGYFIALASPEVRDFYGGFYGETFLLHMRQVFVDTPVLVAFQVFRGLVWALLGALVIRTSRGSVWMVGLLVGLLFGLLPTDSLLFDNPLMPEAIRRVHFVETSLSNFILGWAVTWLLHRPHASLRDLFGRPAGGKLTGVTSSASAD